VPPQESLPAAPSKEEQQLDLSIYLALLSEEHREQLRHYLRVRRARQEPDKTSSHQQVSA
jgi:hypothetical protein